MKRAVFLCIALVAMVAAGHAWAGPVSVFVSIAPQKYFVQEIGGDLVNVNVLVEPGASPHSYEPKPRQMADISKASAYFAIGVEFENVWLGKLAAANPKMKVVHTDEGIKKKMMKAHHHHDDEGDEHHDEDHAHKDEGHEHHDEDHAHKDEGHEHHDEDHAHKDEGHEHHDEGDEHHDEGHEGDHDHHGGLSDPHIWLSPSLVKIQAKHILNGLVSVDPDNADMYKTRYNKFIARVEGLDSDIKNTLSGARGMKFLVFHPTWGYFADEYGLEQIAIEVEGKEPKPAQLKEIIEHAREEGIRVVFVQPQFSSKSAAMIARAIDGQVVTADPLAENWAENLRKQAQAFKEVLK